MRIGLYGGSFDPVHAGHLLVAHAALEEMGLDRIIFIPASESPFKAGRRLAPGPVRLRLLRLALAGCPRFGVDDLEIQRGGVSYTIDTVREMDRRHPGVQWCWLIGADHVEALASWKDAAVLAEMLEFIVIPRPGQESAALPGAVRHRRLRGWPFGISASEIRERAAAGLPVAHLLPPAVAEAVVRDGLYARAPRGGL